MRVEIGIPTKGRPRILGRCLAALLSQTFTDWDLTIVNDSPDVPFHPITLWMMALISDAGHNVRVIQAGGWGQVAGHNWVLYNTEQEAVLRLDDDIILNRDALQHLVNALEAKPNIGAVAGLYFYEGWAREDMLKGWEKDALTNGVVLDQLNSHAQQVRYHFLRNNEPQPVEHLYSSCLYRVKAMKQVGGWPEVYSLGVAANEETEGTYKLHLAGWDLLVIPQATGVHLWAVEGGIRTKGQGHVATQYTRDTSLFASRLPELRATNFGHIKVGIYGNFHYGIGGAQKLFYHTVALLQQAPELDVYPIFRGPYWSPDESEELFGCRYELRAEPPQVDVQIAIGHRVLVAIPAGRYIQYTLFPDPSGDLNVPAQFVGISPFTSDWITRKWGKPARTICPVVEPIPAMEKEKWILVVGRLEPAKAYLELIQTFLEMALAGWELHIVGANTQGFHGDYEAEVAALAEELPNITLHYDISRAEVRELYGKASILWAAKGIRAHEGSEYRPNLCEHFGYTPIEAATAGCVPIAFDDGGHQYSVPPVCRWSNKEGLIEATQKLTEMPSRLEIMQREALALAEKFTDEAAYIEQWVRLIQRVNGMALDCREAQIKVRDAPLKVACIVDHPSLTLGFAVVANQILAGFHEAGYQVAALGSYSLADPKFGADLPYPVWRCAHHGADGPEKLGALLQAEKPDVIWINKDIGAMGEWVHLLKGKGFDGPIVGYFPVEGLPLWRGFVNIIKALHVPVTYLRFGAEAIGKEIGRPVEFLVHGVDHAPFRRLPDDVRQALREARGWENHWVVGYMGRNKRVQAQWRLIYAAALLKRMGMEDVLIYLHCRPTEYGWNEGFDLMDICQNLGVTGRVIFPPDRLAGHGVSWESMVEVYNCLDFYVHPAEVEGFGLPPLEAMASKVPVAVTHDGLAMTEVVGDAGILMGLEGKSMWFTMAQLANVSPSTMAQVIVEARKDPVYLAELAERGQQRAAEFKWEPTRKRMVEIVAEAYQAWQEYQAR